MIRELLYTIQDLFMCTWHIGLIAIVYAFLRANHDNTLNEGAWKRWAVIEAGFVCIVTSLLLGLLLGDWIGFIFLPLIFTLWFSIAFDIFCGLCRAGKVFYFGSGVWDQKMKKIFRTPLGFFMFKLTWLIVISGAYASFLSEHF